MLCLFYFSFWIQVKQSNRVGLLKKQCFATKDLSLWSFVMSHRAVIKTMLRPLRTATATANKHFATTGKDLLTAQRPQIKVIKQPTCRCIQIDCHITDPPLKDQHPIRSGHIGLHLILTRKSKREIPLWIMTVLAGLNKQLWCNPTSSTTHKYTHTLV